MGRRKKRKSKRFVPDLRIRKDRLADLMVKPPVPGEAFWKDLEGDLAGNPQRATAEVRPVATATRKRFTADEKKKWAVAKAMKAKAGKLRLTVDDWDEEEAFAEWLRVFPELAPSALAARARTEQAAVETK